MPLLVASTALLAAGCGPSSPEASRPASTPVAVSVDRVTAVALPSRVEAGGIVQAGSTAQVASRVVAPIVAVHVRAGDRVSRGQPLVTLDAREVTAYAGRASAASEAAAQAAHAASSRMAAAEAGLRLAAATHRRISALHDKRSATPQELDQAAAALQSAEAQVQGARAESASATAARDAARAAADAASVTQSYAVLTAPFDGRIAERMADPGSLASPGVPLLVVEEAGPQRLEVRLDESRAADVAPGQQADARLDGDGANTWVPARVVEVSRADPASHAILVKLALPPDTAVRTGSFGRARFAGSPRQTLVAPSASLVRRAGLTFAFVVDADNVARLRPIVAGAVEGDRTEILAGLAAQDRVVVSPPPALSDGNTVTIRPVAAPQEQRP